MRHRVAKKRFSRSTSHRIAMMRNMVTSLIEHERIETTVIKAKELRKLAEKMISLGKEGSLNARRRAVAIVRTKAAVAKLFSDLAERFKDRKGGYTRVLKLGFRLGDAAPMALIEYVDYDPSEKINAELNKSADKEAEKKKPAAKKKVVAAEETKEKKVKKVAKPKKEAAEKKVKKVTKKTSEKKIKKEEK
ncbi:MAG: 50S ribosomal protein L17 [Deltaproteobacteria bacterium]|nr:50S ribosomal protein L17 [Deltaproteobacteria bacterium]